MTQQISDIAFTPSVKAVQTRMGSRVGYEKMEQRGGWNDGVTPQLEEFLAERDSFYLGTASAAGRPYIQHRGGPKGVLQVLDSKTVAFADFTGNKQYISVGNLAENDKAYIFLMDYPNRTRIKIWGRAEVVEDDPELLDRIQDPGYPGRVERAIKFHIEAWDVNCRQHIVPRYTEEDLAPRVLELTHRIEELEAKLRAYENSSDGRASKSA
jgi:predicted pyridoxine 5'-phosphate oxidase superfamily flavin-nucleotide-binding protein